jgi:hypothetical protein
MTSRPLPNPNSSQWYPAFLTEIDLSTIEACLFRLLTLRSNSFPICCMFYGPTWIFSRTLNKTYIELFKFGTGKNLVQILGQWQIGTFALQKIALSCDL